MQSFKNIYLIGRSTVSGIEETLVALTKYLLYLKINVWVETATAALIPDNNFPSADIDALPPEIDLILVVGGDGSLLQASHFAIHHDLPVLGINRGRLGFLTDIHPESIDKVRNVFSGDFTKELRMMLSAEVHYEGQIEHDFIALNDIALLPGDLVNLIEFDIHINKQFVASQRGDGLIIATPTGSTAYALSGGGPILHPKLNAIELVPMLPHRLSSRPIVIDSESYIEIHIKQSNINSPHISADGEKREKIKPGSVIKIKKYPKELQLIHPSDYNYFSTLREKLGWEHRGTY